MNSEDSGWREHGWLGTFLGLASKQVKESRQGRQGRGDPEGTKKRDNKSKHITCEKQTCKGKLEVKPRSGDKWMETLSSYTAVQINCMEDVVPIGAGG